MYISPSLGFIQFVMLVGLSLYMNYLHTLEISLDVSTSVDICLRIFFRIFFGKTEMQLLLSGVGITD